MSELIESDHPNPANGKVKLIDPGQLGQENGPGAVSIKRDSAAHAFERVYFDTPTSQGSDVHAPSCVAGEVGQCGQRKQAAIPAGLPDRAATPTIVQKAKEAWQGKSRVGRSVEAGSISIGDAAKIDVGADNADARPGGSSQLSKRYRTIASQRQIHPIQFCNFGHDDYPVAAGIDRDATTHALERAHFDTSAYKRSGRHIPSGVASEVGQARQRENTAHPAGLPDRAAASAGVPIASHTR